MNLAWQIEQYFPEHILELVKDISKQADEMGQRVYLVGGVVRDLLLGYANFDLDLVVEGDALALARQIAETHQAKLIIHPRFGTAKLSYGDFTFDMATARGETYACSGALPTVVPGVLNDDLIRRDFSVNAMAVSLSSNNYGDFIDPHNGKDDLERRLIHVLHNESFRDDATRILRAIRYEQRLNFKLEARTAQLLGRDIPMLDTISGDRLRHELELIFREKCPELAINRLNELGVLQRIKLPIKANGWIAEKFDKARRLNKPRQLLSLYFCLLIYPLDEKGNEQLLYRLKISKRLSRAMRDTLLLKAKLFLLDEPHMKPGDIYYLLDEYDPLAIQTNAITSELTVTSHYLQLFLAKLRNVKTSLSGEDLKEMGIAPGPAMGSILQILHRAKLDGEVNTEADERKLVLLLKSSDDHSAIE